MKFKPLFDRVLVKRTAEDTKTAGGIIIPDTAKEKPSKGEVIAVGMGGRDEQGKTVPMTLKVGDQVLFGKMVGYGSQNRRRRTVDYERIRRSGYFGIIF